MQVRKNGCTQKEKSYISLPWTILTVLTLNQQGHEAEAVSTKGFIFSGEEACTSRVYFQWNSSIYSHGCDFHCVIILIKFNDKSYSCMRNECTRETVKDWWPLGEASRTLLVEMDMWRAAEPGEQVRDYLLRGNLRVNLPHGFGDLKESGYNRNIQKHLFCAISEEFCLNE